MIQRFRFIFLYAATFFVGCSYGFSYLYLLLVEHLGGSIITFGHFLTVLGFCVVLTVGFAGRVATKLGPISTTVLGSLCCALGFALFGMVHSMNIGFYIAGIVVLLGYAYTYTVTPMIINNTIADHVRVKHSSTIAAFVVLGVGIGPTMGKFFLSQGLSLSTIYFLAAGGSLIAAVLFYLQRNCWQEVAVIHSATQANRVGIWHGKALYSYYFTFCSGAIYGLLMNFQIVYAQARHFDFAIYYGFYTAMVVLTRLALGNRLAKFDLLTVIYYLLWVMLAGLLLLLINTNSQLIYAATAMIIAVGYGTSFPLFAVYAVNATAAKARHRVLAVITLSFYVGMYAFPYLTSRAIHYFGINALLGLLLFLSLLQITGCYHGLRKFKLATTQSTF